MASRLQKETKKRLPFESLEQEAALNLQKTADHLLATASDTFKGVNLSPTQYNVLRILRGAGEPLACGEIADRMITREPDMTRLLDRLEKRGLITRSRSTSDRRVVETSITAKGLELLKRLDEPVVALHERQLGHLGKVKLRQLIELLEQARGS
jgi:DNA-binding MarR family transcriptional regulator